MGAVAVHCKCGDRFNAHLRIVHANRGIGRRLRIVTANSHLREVEPAASIPRTPIWLSSQSKREFAPPDRFGIEEPGANTLDELLRRHCYPRIIQVANSHDEDVAGGETGASKGSARYMMRHCEMDDCGLARDLGRFWLGYMVERETSKSPMVTAGRFGL